jgi:transposase-like protein
MPVALDLDRAVCPYCKAKETMVPHASYLRHFVYIKDGEAIDEPISIQRLRCKSCDNTHAVLPLATIPYMAFSIRFIARIVIDKLTGTFSSVEALCAHYGISTNTFYRQSKSSTDSSGKEVNGLNSLDEKQIWKTFDLFCKRLLSNTAKELYRKQQKKKAREAVFSELSAHDLASLYTEDSYGDVEEVFDVQGDPVVDCQTRFLLSKSRPWHPLTMCPLTTHPHQCELAIHGEERIRKLHVYADRFLLGR